VVGVGVVTSSGNSGLGVTMTSVPELFEEALQVIRAIWTSDDVYFEGSISPRAHYATPPIMLIRIRRSGSAAHGGVRQRVALYGDGCVVPGTGSAGSDRPALPWHRLAGALSDRHRMICGADAMRPAEIGRDRHHVRELRRGNRRR